MRASSSLPFFLAATLSLAPPAGAAESPREATSPRVATPVGAWIGAPAKDGGLAYCVQSAKYSTGHTLVIGRTRSGAVNVALSIPGGALPVGERWPVSVRVDGALARERVATAANAAMLVVPLGKDPDMFTQLKRGNTFFVKSSGDHIGFALKGTAQALKALERCAETLPASPEPPVKDGAKAGKGVPTEGEAAKGADAPDATATPPVFPQTLAAILGAAGLTEVQALTFPDLPPEKRPADYAWRVGEVLGGVRERVVPAELTLDALSTEYVEALRSRCKGAGTARLSPVEHHRLVTIRLGAVDCAPAGDGKGSGVHVALVSYLSEARLFATFFHEATPENAAVADDIRDRLAAVFRRVAAMPPEDGAQGEKPRADGKEKTATPHAVSEPAVSEPAAPQPAAPESVSPESGSPPPPSPDAKTEMPAPIPSEASGSAGSPESAAAPVGSASVERKDAAAPKDPAPKTK